jgi:hypothetical protein
MTVHQLNMSWTVAAEKALRNSSRLPICVSDTIVFVTDVPMFDPMMIGTANRKLGMTEMARRQSLYWLCSNQVTMPAL